MRAICVDDERLIADYVAALCRSLPPLTEAESFTRARDALAWLEDHSADLALLDISTIVTFLGIVDFIPTIKNMKIGNDTLRTLNYDANKIRLVLNRSDAKTRINLQDVVRILGENFYHILPNDFESARQSIATGVPLVLSDHDSALARELRNLVGRYTNKGYMEDTPTKSSSWLTKIFN